MSTLVSPAARASRSATADAGVLRVGLFGYGLIGSAVAALARARPDALGRPVAIATALVRRTANRPAAATVPLTDDPETVFRAEPDVIIEVLGGVEPARTLVLRAIERGIPVVTANKALLAHHGDELLDAAASAGVRLCYEASVIAGVPFLSTLARRPLASSVTAFTGIVNGTTNYILSQIATAGASYDVALADAQRRGFAEPDPSKDVDGLDALEKLVVLVRQLASCSVSPSAIETNGITRVTAADLAHAAGLGGTIKPIVHAEWSGAGIRAYAGPAFVPRDHPLARVAGSANGIHLRDAAGSDLFFSGPGAGPGPTSVTILDDVLDAVSWAPPAAPVRLKGHVEPPQTAWLIRLTSQWPLPPGEDLADLFGASGVWMARTSSRDSRDGGESVWLLTYPAARDRMEAAVRDVSAAARCDAALLRAAGACS
ncbi:MAG TPA: homoserine dehydrogenase [Vicinamibacterales bacterium]|nr:homoserine dehydrogenase [Vicinamibacterales bacterium]